MSKNARRIPLTKEKLVQAGALAVLLLLGLLALAGPYGVLAWGEYSSILDKRKEQISVLEEERAVLRNRVKLLDPDHVDPDLASEIVRRDLNVAHPDEYVMEVDKPN